MELEQIILGIVGAHLTLDVWRWVVGSSRVQLWRKRRRRAKARERERRCHT